jgi:hypothetical protein
MLLRQLGARFTNKSEQFPKFGKFYYQNPL